MKKSTPRPGKQAASAGFRVAGREPHKRRAAPKKRRGTGLTMAIASMEVPKPLPPIKKEPQVQQPTSTPTEEISTETEDMVVPLPAFKHPQPVTTSHRRPSMLRGQGVAGGRKKKRKTLWNFQSEATEKITLGSLMKDFNDSSDIGFDELPEVLEGIQLKAPIIMVPSIEKPKNDNEDLLQEIGITKRESFQFEASKHLRSEEFEFDTDTVKFLTEFITRGFERLRELVALKHIQEREAEADRRQELKSAVEWIASALESRVQRRDAVIEEKRSAARFLNEDGLERLREELLLLEFDADEEEEELREAQTMIKKLQSDHVVYETQSDARRSEEVERRYRIEDMFLEKVTTKLEEFLEKESADKNYEPPTLIEPQILGETVDIMCSFQNVEQVTEKTVPKFVAASKVVEPTAATDGSAKIENIDQTMPSSLDTLPTISEGALTKNQSGISNHPDSPNTRAPFTNTPNTADRPSTAQAMMVANDKSNSEKLCYKVTYEVKRQVEHLEMQRILLTNRISDHVEERRAVALADTHINRLYAEIEKMRARMEFNHVIDEQIARVDRAVITWLENDDEGNKELLWLKIYDQELCKQLQYMKHVQEKLWSSGLAIDLEVPKVDLNYIEHIAEVALERVAEVAKYENISAVYSNNEGSPFFMPMPDVVMHPEPEPDSEPNRQESGQESGQEEDNKGNTDEKVTELKVVEITEITSEEMISNSDGDCEVMKSVDEWAEADEPEYVSSGNGQCIPSRTYLTL